jgi:hypothetical protein
VAKRSILEPEFSPLDSTTGEKVLFHASKAVLTYKPSVVKKLAAAVGNMGGAQGGRRRQTGGHNVKAKGELVITNEAFWFGRVHGLFKKRRSISFCAIHNPNLAEGMIQDGISEADDRAAAVAASGVAPGSLAGRMSRWSAASSQSMWLVTTVATGKGFIRKGFDIKAVRFNPGGHRSGILQYLRTTSQSMAQSAWTGDTWSFRISKLGPESEGLSEGALDGILESAKANGSQMLISLPRWNQMTDAAKSAATARM